MLQLVELGVDTNGMAVSLESEHRRHILDTAFIGALSVALYVAFPPFSDIYRLWRREAGLAIIGGLGRGEFEYPPIGALYFEPLSWLPSSRLAVLVNGTLMVVAAVGVTWLLSRAADDGFSERMDMRLWSLSPALLLFLPVNWDVGAVYLTVAAAMTFYLGRSGISGSLFAAGTSLKIFPGVPVLLLVPLLSSWKQRLRFLLPGLAVLAVAYTGYAVLRPATWTLHIGFAGSRTDFEATIWGLVDRIAGLAGTGLSVSAVNSLSIAALALSVVGLAVWAWRKHPDPVQVILLSLIALLLFNKVYKPQYVLWIIPFLAWIGTRRWQVRVLEVASIAQMAVTYFALSNAIVGVATVVRTLILILLGASVFQRARQGATRRVEMSS